MNRTAYFVAAAAIAGACTASFVPEVSYGLQRSAALVGLTEHPAKAQQAQASPPKKAPREEPAHAEHGEHSESGEPVRLSDEQIESAGIKTEPAGPGVLAKTMKIPGVVVPAGDRLARVAANVVGTVAEMRKRLGDRVQKGEVVAVLNSREVADIKNEYLGASVNHDLQKTLFERDQQLFQKGIAPEQQFLRSRATFTEAQLRLEVARHKLSALGITQAEISALSRQSADLQRYELRAPIAGRVIERLATIGAAVGMEGQPKELYGLADLSEVWVELAVSTRDLPRMRKGQSIQVQQAGSDTTEEGTIVFKSPLLNAETRSARVIAQLSNESGQWQPGAFVTASIVVDEQKVSLLLPKAAIQTVEKEQVAFVRTSDGFVKRPISPGRSDGRAVEIVAGLRAGEEVATVNAFMIKAEHGKSEAAHDD